jgi:enoyl-CoA hydratase/carnithine racemase
MWTTILLRIGIAAAEQLIPGLQQGAKKKEIALLAAQAAAQEFAKLGLVPAVTPKEEMAPEVDNIVADYNKKGWPQLEPDATRIVLTPTQLEGILRAARGQS